MMHQHPRQPPSNAAPANTEQNNPHRTNNLRDRDIQSRRTASPLTPGSGSSEDFVNARQDQPVADPAAQMQRLNQVIQNFYTKATLIILHSRIDLSPAYSAKTNEKRVNKWFNIELDETDDYIEDIKRWKRCDVKDNRPQPLIIEVFLTTDPLGHGHRLVILDDDQNRWDVNNALETSQPARNGKKRMAEAPEIILERWTIELGNASTAMPADLASVLPLVYKKSIVLFRSLYTYCNFLPTWKLSRRVGKGRSNMALKLGFRIVDGSRLDDLARYDNLEVPLCGNNDDVVTDYSFGVTESPAGPFSVQVKYRENCDFRVDDSEELLSSRFLGAEDDLFRPPVLKAEGRDRQHVGSLPNDQRRSLMERPELGHAYGSLSTFHQAGISSGTSPISALRSAKDLGGQSPSPEQTRPPPTQRSSTHNPRSSLRAAVTERRSSFTFQPFKTPTLSASPLASSPLAASPRSSARIPTLGSLTEEEQHLPRNGVAIATQKVGSLTTDPIVSSTSSSPKPAPVTRFSSSFTHRRGRLSTDRTTNRTDEDQGSSGKASATSSTAQPGSGLMAEPVAGGSSGSVQDDDENISDFLKMLDTKKDLLAPTTTSAADASVRRTVAALQRFHQMRDSNAALSDSMSSSLMLPRSPTSSSRQLSSVPPMVGATSASTSSSPGKPVSPHTPHTPFAPSRLSAAYSHDETEVPTEIEVEDDPDAGSSDATAVPPSSANVPAIDIPNSPRPFQPAYRRSSSVQRPPLSSDEDIADLYGMRSASMGAQGRKAKQAEPHSNAAHETTETEKTHDDSSALRPDVSPQRSSIHQRTGVAADGTASDSGSGRSSAQNVYRSRFARGGAVGRGVTPPLGSTSSFGGTGASLERGIESGSASGSWGRGRIRSGSKPQFDEDEFMPFAMETSHFNSKPSEDNNKGGRAHER